jgi:hypothetical protein
MARAESSQDQRSETVNDALKSLVRLLARQAAAEVHSNQNAERSEQPAASAARK